MFIVWSQTHMMYYNGKNYLFWENSCEIFLNKMVVALIKYVDIVSSHESYIVVYVVYVTTISIAY